MIVLDANVLLYAYDTESPWHEKSAAWLDNQFSGRELIGLPWVTIWAFIRVRTNRRAVARPSTIAESFAIVRDWLSQPSVVLVQPGVRHVELLEHVATTYGAGGAMLSDAVVAALALEHGAAVASTDRDFSRFTELRRVNPLG